MNMGLRGLLIFASIVTVIAVVLKIRKSKFQIHDGVFWFLLSLIFLVLSIFPRIAMRLSDLLGIDSPANFVFLCVITLLLAKNFFMSIKISLLEYNLMKLTQHVVVEEAENTSAAVETSSSEVSENIKEEIE